MNKKNIQGLIRLYLEEKSNIASVIEISKIQELFNTIKQAYNKDGYVYILGNGGSAAIAEGFAVDLKTHPFVKEDKSTTTDIQRLKVISLVNSSSLITGISNDLGNEMIFSEQMKNFSRNSINKYSILICLSGSGNSQNVLEAIRFAKEENIKTSVISGRGGGKASKLVDIPIVIPGTSKFPGQIGKNDNNFHIEDYQNSISHIIVGLLKYYIEQKNN